jgi:hypothetical protein
VRAPWLTSNVTSGARCTAAHLLGPARVELEWNHAWGRRELRRVARRRVRLGCTCIDDAPPRALGRVRAFRPSRALPILEFSWVNLAFTPATIHAARILHRACTAHFSAHGPERTRPRSLARPRRC